jgi:cytochrome b561
MQEVAAQDMEQWQGQLKALTHMVLLTLLLLLPFFLAGGCCS